MCRIEELCYFAAIFLKRNKVLLVESIMVQSRNKELDVALELFNSELEKLKLKEKELAIVKRAEKKKADAVKALQDAENNPDLSAEEKEQAKAAWLKADDDLKRILAGEDPLPEEDVSELAKNEDEESDDEAIEVEVSENDESENVHEESAEKTVEEVEMSESDESENEDHENEENTEEVAE